MLALAAGATVAAVIVTRADDGGRQATAAYACPMHPEVTGPKPGACPICGMALEATHPAAGRGHMDMSALGDLAAVENVRRHKIVDFVRSHSLLFDTREMRGSAWVEGDHTISAVFYKDQIDVLAADEPGTFTLAASPKVALAVRRIAGAATPWDESTSLIRFQPAPGPGAGTSLELGQIGWVEIARKSRDVLGVPASAILQSPEGPYVLLATSDVTIEKRPIQIGETFLKQGFAVLLGGLKRHDLVVARATFFLDADRRLGARAREAGGSTP